MDKSRCPWSLKDQLYRDYHDHEWGIPVHEDRRLFEKLILEGMQAGLSWYTILVKRPAFRTAFDGFEAEKMVRYDERKIAELMANPGIIRNRAKIQAAIHNARAYLAVQEAFGSFDAYIWQFTEGKTMVNQPRSLAEIPAITPASTRMSRDLKQRGFRFVGPTTAYAFMQAMGMVDDHLVDCWCKSR
ncbi:MAG: DNA-3-methyladenine glycosylase I [Bacteroidetes bacterium]|nr:MAG: DNA-3-methyladenine glycosylase I [Bacteroidota bacterium]